MYTVQMVSTVSCSLKTACVVFKISITIGMMDWCTGKTQRDRLEGEVGEGIGMGNTCKSMLIHFNVLQNSLQYCKVISLQLIKKFKKKKISLTIGMMDRMYILKTRERVRSTQIQFASQPDVTFSR